MLVRAVGVCHPLAVMGSPSLDLHHWLALGPTVFAACHHALRQASRHTGIPAIVIAALVIVLSRRMVRAAVRLAIEVAIVAIVLVAATMLGWVSW
jgi:uncharacterized membrane protein YGL010W